MPALLSRRRPGVGGRGRVPQTRGPPVGGSCCVQPHLSVRRLPSLTQEGRSHPGSVQGRWPSPHTCLRSWLAELGEMGPFLGPGWGCGWARGLLGRVTPLFPAFLLGSTHEGVVAASFLLRPSSSLIWGNLGSEECDVCLDPVREGSGPEPGRPWGWLPPCASLEGSQRRPRPWRNLCAGAEDP